MTREAFRRAVAAAVDALPAKFKQALENIEIVIEDEASRAQLRKVGAYGLLGLYEGVPLPERTSGYSGVLPDKITLFQRALEDEADGDAAELREEIARTLRHEIGHYFGLSDQDLDRLGH